MKIIHCYMIGIATLGCASCNTAGLKLSSEAIDEAVASMTLEEKANFVVGTERIKVYPPDRAPGMPIRDHFTPEFQAKLDACKTDEERNALLVATSTSASKVQGAAGQHYAIERLGLQPIVYADGPAGLRIDPQRDGDESTYYCTAFPVGAALASSWDTDLVREVATAIGNEVREYGVDVLLAPGVNIHRSPLCGRNFEYFSEDPIVAGSIAAAYIDGVQSNGVGVSLKHFAVNSQETCRNGVDARVSERALREIYLRGFEYAVRNSQPWTIMTSYNKINGVLASENKWLLTDVLRGEWGFEGFVMTDWWAEENGARQIAAGNDLLMPGTQRQYDEIITAIGDSTLAMADLDACVKRILHVMAKTPTYADYKYSNKPDLEAHAAVTRKAATDGMVLLKNEGNTLPLNAKKIALFGTASYDLLVGGSGSGNVNRKYKVSLNEGLKHQGVALIESQEKEYLQYIADVKASQPKENFWAVPTVPEKPLNLIAVKEAIAAADVAVFTLSRMAGEGGDRKVEKGDYLLSDVENANIRMVCEEAHAAGKKAILVLNMGNMVELTDVCQLPDAILHAWMGGQEMGNSLADVLMGKIYPTGKLTFTWAKRYNDYPSANNFPESDGNAAYANYAEDVMVGYRHFVSRGVEPLYPFGYGLSYTTFAYDKASAKTDGEKIKVTLSVTNTGSKEGREIVQLYVTQPTVEGLMQPARELKAFAKTRALKPGESEEVTLECTKEALSYYNEQTHQWTLPSCEYKLLIGASSLDIRSNLSIDL